MPAAGPGDMQKSKAAYRRAEILENSEVAPRHYLMGFRPETAVSSPKPGQFCMVGPSGRLDPLLKRPFCYVKSERDASYVLYRVTGRGTTVLSQMKPGELVDVLGPLGNSWPRPQAASVPVIVAGGIGIASVYPFIKSLRKKSVLIYGGRGSDELLLLSELKATEAELHTSTEDGSHGVRGTVMEVLEELNVPDKHVLYTCGPRGMLVAVADFARERGIKGYVSLEERMACGMGACLGCAVKTTRGYKGVCSSGPVFKISDIDWEGLR